MSNRQCEGNGDGRPKRRKDFQEKHDKLCGLLLSRMETDGHDWKGQTWAPALPLTEWAEMAGLSLSSLKRLIKEPPILSQGRGWGKEKVVLLRVGGELDPQEAKLKLTANVMAKAYREHMATLEEPEKWKVTPRGDWGLIRGLAETWPEGWQVKIFNYTLKGWPAFMDAVKLELEAAWLLREAGVEVVVSDAIANHTLRTAWLLQDVDIGQFRRWNDVKQRGEWWTWKKPRMSFLRRFPHVAAQRFYFDHPKMQEALGSDLFTFSETSHN